jgi:hypothetical protein
MAETHLLSQSARADTSHRCARVRRSVVKKIRAVFSRNSVLSSKMSYVRRLPQRLTFSCASFFSSRISRKITRRQRQRETSVDYAAASRKRATKGREGLEERRRNRRENYSAPPRCGCEFYWLCDVKCVIARWPAEEPRQQCGRPRFRDGYFE